METEFVIWFTLRPLRQAPCSKELCSFSYPKTDYEQSLNTQHVDPRLRVDLVDNCPKTQPPPLMCWGLNLHHTSPLFPPSILPPNLPLFFPSSFLPSQQAGGTNTAEKRPLLPPHPLLHFYWNFLLRGKWRTGGYRRRSVLRRRRHNERRRAGSGWMDRRGGDSGFSVHLM